MNSNGLIKRQVLRASALPKASHAIKPLVHDVATPSAAPLSPPAVVPSVPLAEIEQIKEAAHREGLALGRKQAQKDAEQTYREQLAALSQLIESIRAAWNTERKRIEATLADFAFAATNRMLGDTLRDPRVAGAAVKSMLAGCEGWQALTLEVHPRDLDCVQQALSQDPETAHAAPRVVASEAVRVGGCRISGTEGSLDARLEFQLEQLRQRLDAERVNGGPAT